MAGNIYEDVLSSEYNLSPSLDDLFPEINLNTLGIDDEVNEVVVNEERSCRNEVKKCNEVKLEAKLCQWTSNRKTLVSDTNGTFLFMKASCNLKLQ